MKDGFLRVGSATPVVKVGDIDYNVSQIKKVIDEACQNKLRMIVLPELCVTAYTCGDLFGQDLLIHEAEQAVKELSTYLQGKDLVVVVGFPLQYCGNLYNCAGVLFDGKILGVVPKYHLPNYSEFYEARKFSQGQRMVKMIPFADQIVPFGMNLLFSCENIKEFVLALEICEDLWVPNPPSIDHALHGATVIANTSASNEVTGKVQYRKNLVMGQSGRLVCAYLFSSAGEGESTTDLVFSGHNMIAENGTMICESNRFSTGLIFTEIDVKKIIYERRKMSTFECHVDDDYYTVSFAYSTEAVQTQTELSRTFSKFPLIKYHGK